MSTQQVILTGILVYLACLAALGFWASTRTRSAEDFLVAGRSMPVWMCTATIIATWLGGASMLGASGQAYQGGLFAVLADPFGAALGVLLIGLFVIGSVRRMRLLTVVEFVEYRYGTSLALLWSVYAVAANVGWVGATMVAFGFVFSTLVGLPLEVGIVVGGIIVVLYAMAGGMWAVAYTDFLQLSIIVVGALFLLVLVVEDLGGVLRAWEAVPAEKLRLIPAERSVDAWLNYVHVLFILSVTNLSAQALLQRGFSARSERAAQSSFILAAFGYLAIALIPVALGILGSLLIPDLQDRQAIVPTLAVEYLSPVLLAIFVGALLSAIMSTADSALLATASIVSVNILPRIWPGTAQRKLMMARVTILVTGALAIIVALQAQTIFELILAINAPALAATVAPFILALAWKGANRTGGWAAVVTGLLIWGLVALLAPSLPGDLIGMAASFVALIAGSLASQRRDPPPDRTLGVC